MKKVLATHGAPNRHWVGNGFPVHGMFGYSGADQNWVVPAGVTRDASARSSTAIPPAMAVSSVPAMCSG